MKERQAESSGVDLGNAKGKSVPGRRGGFDGKMSNNFLVGQSRQVGVHREWHAVSPRDRTFESRMSWHSGSQ